MRKRYTLAVIAPLLLITMMGCAAKTGGTSTLPNGAIDQTDATVYRVLTDAQVLLNEIRAGVTSGKLTLTPIQKTTFNALITSYDVTEAQWQTYHAGASKDAAGLTASANTLSANLASAQSTILVSQ